MDLIDRIRENAPTGSEIPKPAATEPFRVKGWGRRRGQDALIYTIPNKKGGRPYEKGITVDELYRAHQSLLNSGIFSRRWFIKHLPDCAKEGSCNFTTIGGLFVLIGDARYEKEGEYSKN